MCVCTYQRSSNSPLRPPPFTNTCIILSGRKGPVSYSFLSSDTSQASEGVAEGLMMPLLKARACLRGMTGPANYLIPSPLCDFTGQCLRLQISLSTRCPQRVPRIFCFFLAVHPLSVNRFYFQPVSGHWVRGRASAPFSFPLFPRTLQALLNYSDHSSEMIIFKV